MSRRAKNQTPRITRLERGMSESMQWAVLVPVIMLTLLGCIDAGVWLHARSVVQQAALTAAETQALAGSSAGQAELVAEQITEDLDQVQIITSHDGQMITVSITARASLALDLGDAQVQASATRAVER